MSKCENRAIFAMSFERDSAFKLCFKGSKAQVLVPPKKKENQEELLLHAHGRALHADIWIEPPL